MAWCIIGHLPAVTVPLVYVILGKVSLGYRMHPVSQERMTLSQHSSRTLATNQWYDCTIHCAKLRSRLSGCVVTPLWYRFVGLVAQCHVQPTWREWQVFRASSRGHYCLPGSHRCKPLWVPLHLVAKV